MKKIYKAPIAEYVDTEILPILSNTSFPATGGTDPDDEEGRGDGSDGMANEYQGDWSNIWGNM